MSIGRSTEARDFPSRFNHDHNQKNAFDKRKKKAEDKPTNEEILQYLSENDMISLSQIQEEITEMKRKELLEKHPYKIWKGSDDMWHTYLPSEDGKRVPRRRWNRSDLEQLVADYWKEKEENPTIREVFNAWNDRRMELGKISISTYQRYTRNFDRHYIVMGKRRIKEITPQEIEDFLEEEVCRNHLTAKAFGNLKSITKGFLKYAKKKKMISFAVEELFDDMDMSDRDFKRVIKEDKEEVFNQEEMEVMLQYLETHLDTQNIGILLMFVTGIRVGELVTLRHSDFEGNTIKIRRTETLYKDTDGVNVYAVKEFPKSKAGVRTVVLPEDYAWLSAKIAETNPQEEYVFCNEKGRMTTNCIRMRLKRLCEELHIYKKSPHKIRKTYGSILLDNNVDDRLVTELMGHSNISVTENHYHRNRRDIDDKISRISVIPEFKAAR